MKYLLLVVVVLLVLGVLRSRRAPGGTGQGRQPSSPPAPPQDMLACAHCGVHVPRADALLLHGQPYCCAQHRSLGPAG